MSSYNKCTFVGNLTEEVALTTFASGGCVATGSIACNRKYKNKAGDIVEDVDYIPFQIFNKGAEIVEKYTKKGHSILLSGSMRLFRWETKAGDKRTELKLHVEDFTLLNNNKQPSDGSRQQNHRKQKARKSDQHHDEEAPF